MRRATIGAEDAALVEDLERRFVTTVDRVEIGRRAIDLMRPRSAEDLISEADFERDERLPYWADIWPSAIVLANALAREDGMARPLLELGCGVGLVTIVAMRAGFDVLATDYYEDALRFTRVNALRSLGDAPRTQHVDWRHFPADLGIFERVLASDVLYERPYGALVAAAIDATLSPGGIATIADPGRVGVEDFLARCAERQLDVRSESVPFESGSIRQTIRLYDVRRRLATTSEMS
ncbi:MAG TPA: methyltransferase domain-containing protein [Gemmatimonadaceae bacterium]|nr:methyltransferase domain-containing protein [Gemmatimonadaceae bacterium]